MFMLSVKTKPIILSAFLLSAIMLSAIMLSVIMLSAIMLSVIMLSVIMLSVIMLSVVMLNAIMPNVVAPFTRGRWELLLSVYLCKKLNLGMGKFTDRKKSSSLKSLTLETAADADVN